MVRGHRPDSTSSRRSRSPTRAPSATRRRHAGGAREACSGVRPCPGVFTRAACLVRRMAARKRPCTPVSQAEDFSTCAGITGQGHRSGVPASGSRSASKQLPFDSRSHDTITCPSAFIEHNTRIGDRQDGDAARDLVRSCRRSGRADEASCAAQRCASEFTAGPSRTTPICPDVLRLAGER